MEESAKLAPVWLGGRGLWRHVARGRGLLRHMNAFKETIVIKLIFNLIKHFDE